MKRLVALGTLVLLAAIVLGGGSALADKPGGEREALNNALEKAADLHLSREGTYDNACGGGYGPPDVATIDNTWEWEIGSGETCWNVGGISATGLLAAYERTGNGDYLNGALGTGNTLVAKYDTIVTNDPEGAEWEDRPFSQDIEFLARLSSDSGDASYSTVAAAWYGIVTSNKTAVETADRYIDNRLSLAGWDLASQIRAAIAGGDVDYAKGMAARLIERRTDWEGISYGGFDYTTVSYASLLWAFGVLGDDTFGSYVAEIRAALLAAQGGEGSWDAGDYQTTAYALLGLASPRTPALVQAVDKGWAFLRDTQTEAGGWSYPPELGEVNSEVLMALGVIRLDEGKKIGFSDPNLGGNDTGRHPLDPSP